MRRTAIGEGRASVRVLATCATVVALACGDDGAADEDAESPAVDAGGDGSEMPDGDDVYRRPFADGNTFACATCHALQEPAADGLRRPGHPIGDAARRASYKNGQLDELVEAVNSCLTEWMNAEPLSADDERFVALSMLLGADEGEAPAPALEFAIVDPPAELEGGEASAGRDTFNATCAVCHGHDAGGSELAPSLIGAGLERDLVARRVRRSGRPDSAVYDGLVGGVMPFWSSDRLDDDELLDLLAYIEDIGDDERETTTGGQGETGDSGCASEHELVGATANFRTMAHGVSGRARVVDDCTIVLEDFSYDGGGIDVQIYAGRDGDYDPPSGFSLSEDLFGQQFERDTLTVRLPEGKSLDDVDGVSVWCVAVGANFGDALFR